MDDVREAIMAKLPLRFLAAVAIPLAVAIGAGGEPAQSRRSKPSAARTRRGG
jgi:hypothetical protein